MKLQILKTGLVFLALNLILIFTTNAQVGIGTTTPKSSLQVEGNPGDTTTPDGVQVPSLTITQLEGKIIGGAYGADQDGAIVYISDASIGSSISETTDIQNKGFYFYFHNGVSGTWRVMGEQKIDLTNPNIVPRWDGTNLIEGSIIDSGGNIGIGTLTPDALLDVEGSFRLNDGTQGTSKILTSDQDGNASWRDLSSESIFGENNLPEADFSCLAISGVLSFGGQLNSIALKGNYAYVVDDNNHDLKVIDVSDPSSPSLTGSLGIGDIPLSIAVAESYAYVVDVFSDDLKVIDISDPSLPSLAGSLSIGFAPVSIAVAESYAYVVDVSSNDLKVIDISDPSSPSLTGSLDIGLYPISIAVSGNYAYVVHQSSDDLRVIDVSNPASPILSGSLGIGLYPMAVAVSGNYAYVVDAISDDLKVIDVSNPVSPILSGSLDIGTFPESVAVSGNYAYVVDNGSDDLKVIDVSNPSSPLLSGSLDFVSFPLSVAVSGNYAYVAGEDGDLKIIELSCSPSLAINPLTGDFETVTESDPKVASSTANVIPKWDGTNLVDGSIFDVDGDVGIGILNPSSKLHVSGDITANRLDTGQGFNELYAMNQNVRTDDNVVFNTISTNNINTGPGATEVHLMNQNVRTNDNVTFNTINTGQGANKLYDMNQNVLTNSNVTFNYINTNFIDTGLGTTEVYLMNQNVRTIDNVTFNRIRAGSGITSTEGTLHIKAQAGVFPNLYLDGGSEDIAVSTGDALQIGHWNGSSFTERLRINSLGDVGIGTSSIDYKLEVNGSAGKPGGSSWSNSSDRRLKQNINPYNEGLNEIVEISPVTYQYNELSGYDTEIEYVGVIAQELLKVAPHMVSTYEIDGVEYYKIDNSAMTYMLINAVKELKAENDELKKKLEKIDQLEAMLIELKADLNVSNNNNSENVVQK